MNFWALYQMLIDVAPKANRQNMISRNKAFNSKYITGSKAATLYLNIVYL